MTSKVSVDAGRQIGAICGASFKSSARTKMAASFDERPSMNPGWRRICWTFTIWCGRGSFFLVPSPSIQSPVLTTSFSASRLWGEGELVLLGFECCFAVGGGSVWGYFRRLFCNPGLLWNLMTYEINSDDRMLSIHFLQLSFLNYLESTSTNWTT